MAPEHGKTLTLIIGGARAGKSTLAVRLGARGDRVLFVATAQARDPEMARRIAAHRAGRPAAWHTVEEPLDLAGALRSGGRLFDTVIVDCLTLWVSNRMLHATGDAPDFAALAGDILKVYEAGAADWIVVTNEVGLGVVPPTESGRAFRDALGRANQVFAHRADRVISMTAGLALDLKSAGAVPLDEFGPL